MKTINLTNADIIKGMSDDMKHNLAIQCQLNKTDPEEVIDNVKNIANSTINFAIDICNKYFETPSGKEYLEIRKKIERIGVSDK